MVTESMQRAIDETNRRRELQMEYNRMKGITPETIRKAIRRGIEEEIEARRVVQETAGVADETKYVTQEFLNELEGEMLQAAENLEFERAAQLRDRIVELKQKMGQESQNARRQTRLRHARLPPFPQRPPRPVRVACEAHRIRLTTCPAGRAVGAPNTPDLASGVHSDFAQPVSMTRLRKVPASP